MEKQKHISQAVAYELLEVCKRGLITIRELNDGHPLRVMEEMVAAIAKAGGK